MVYQSMLWMNAKERLYESLNNLPATNSYSNIKTSPSRLKGFSRISKGHNQQNFIFLIVAK